MRHPLILPTFSKFFFRNFLKLRRLLPRKSSCAFGREDNSQKITIGRVLVINLERQPSRLRKIKDELEGLLDNAESPLWFLTERFAAVDARDFLHDPEKNDNINPVYTLGEQLFVEPQPLAMPSEMELDLEIKMSRPEIAVAMSHIEVWKKIADGPCDYSMVIEDDVWFDSSFTKIIDRAWSEVQTIKNSRGVFDILYLSYEEVRNGAPKMTISETLFRPIRGLWNLSGYIISRQGAMNLLKLLPCKGPVDLWINHQFEHIKVLVTKKSIIHQRPDMHSTNCYSILPALTKIGAITSESAALFQNWPHIYPVFVFGPKNSGLTSIAMALSMLGYRCCNDLETLPETELNNLRKGSKNRTFNAYVNIGCLFSEINSLKKNFPQARIILTSNIDDENIRFNLPIDDYVVVEKDSAKKWKLLSEWLRCSPPVCAFPDVADFGQRQINHSVYSKPLSEYKIPKRDNSPWLIPENASWRGIYINSATKRLGDKMLALAREEHLDFNDVKIWCSREDTFTDNLALFRPKNITLLTNSGVSLAVHSESLGARNYSAAALTSRKKYLYGRFEATIKASNSPGIITGFFLHRDSPRQEIDIEIAGHQPDVLIVNVFYNPGGENARFDYGYRGAPSYIKLGFDASKSFHHYAIEWSANEISWYVDGQLVHQRLIWNPTPIPDLPMSLHVNIWPPRSSELAGRLKRNSLPALAHITAITFKTNQQ